MIGKHDQSGDRGGRVLEKRKEKSKRKLHCRKKRWKPVIFIKKRQEAYQFKGEEKLVFEGSGRIRQPRSGKPQRGRASVVNWKKRGKKHRGGRRRRLESSIFLLPRDSPKPLLREGRREGKRKVRRGNLTVKRGSQQEELVRAEEGFFSQPFRLIERWSRGGVGREIQ